MQFGGLKVLMISTDRNILVPGSAVSERMKEYGALVEELHIVVLSDAAQGLKNTELAPNVWIYPTNSAAKFLRPLGAARIGKKIVLDRRFVRGKSLITAQDPFECGWAALKVARRWRLPLEVQLHTDLFSPYFSGFLNTVRKIMARSALKTATSVRVVSQDVAEALTRELALEPEKISVLPIYVDPDKFREARIAFDLHARYGFHFVILMVARLSAEKNLGEALEVLKRLASYYPDTGLVIVGDGPEKSNLMALADRLGLGTRVVFAGWQEELGSYYRTANLFLQTSRFEGYGLSLVEAGLSGLPVVTTPVGLARDLSSGTDLIVVPHDNTDEMFKAVYDLVSNNAEREILGRNIEHALRGKLLAKGDYLRRLKDNWEKTASSVST